MEKVVEIFTENSGELSVAILIATFYVLLGINEDTLSLNYIKKFNILCYFLYVLLKMIFGFSTLAIILIYMFIVILASLNMSENSSYLEKNLTRRDLITFSFFKWLFKTKFYIFIFVSLINEIIIGLNINDIIVVAVSSTGLLVHQISFIKDYFGYLDFDYLDKKLNEVTFFKDMNILDLEMNKTLISFILHMEDKDFFERKDLNIDLWKIFSRKKINLISKIKKKRHKITFKINFKRLYYKYWRGYSTIEMQVIRNTVMWEDSYQYKIRRKIMVEHIYSKYYYKAVTRKLKRHHIVEFNSDSGETLRRIHTTVKMLFLQYYFVETLSHPEDLDEFISAIKSRVGREKYEESYVKFLESYYRYAYENNFTNNLYDFLIFNYDGGKLMEYHNIESQDGKIFFRKLDGDIEYIEKGESSEHLLSPDKSKIVYISPNEWETIGKVIVYKIHEREKIVVINPDNDENIPKNVIWINDDTLGIIMGYGQGTVAVGGDVYIYKLNSGTQTKLTNYPDEVQITDMKNGENGKLVLTGIKYTDPNFVDFEDFKDMVKIDDIY